MSSATATSRLSAVASHLLSPRLVCVLPDFTKVTATTVLEEGEVTRLSLDDKPVAHYSLAPDYTHALDLSSIGTAMQGATTHVPKYRVLTLKPPAPSGRIAVEDLWGVIHALFVLYYEQEQIPTLISTFANAVEIADYLVSSGLARTYPVSPPVAPTKDYNLDAVYYISRAAFWQGAGTTGFHSRPNWLLHPRPVLPEVYTFTRKDNVVAKHPVRPVKPAPGEVLYRRYCSHVGQMLELIHFDLDGVTDLPEHKTADGVSRHLAAFHKWHNDPRINSAWGEAGTVEKHREYIEGQYRDPHAIPAVWSWDGELMGYVEVNYTKEDHVAPYFPDDQPPGNWDRGLHVLVGESKFLGGGRCEFLHIPLCEWKDADKCA